MPPRVDDDKRVMDVLGASSQFWRGVAEAFEFDPIGSAVPVTDGLSNDLWRVTSGDDTFAAKVMRVNTQTPAFADNLEAAFQVEQTAFDSGIQPSTSGTLPACLPRSTLRVTR
jgi:hypothetical protein